MAAIMVVEDERVVAQDIAETLDRLGYDVIGPTASCADCLQRARVAKPDLVLMDVRIEGVVDGIQTAEQLKAEIDVPVVYLTAYADDQTISRARRTQAHGYLLKPFRSSELKSAIEIALAKHAMDTTLRRRERWFSTTLRAIGDAVIAVDAEAKVAFANPVAEQLTGAGVDDLTGRKLDEVFRLINARTREAMNNPVKDVLAGRAPARLPPGTLLLRDGSELPIEDSMAPIVDIDGELLGAVVVFRDAREQQALREQIAAADRLASLGTLVAGVAHEINNPLTYILANVTMVGQELTRIQQTEREASGTPGRAQPIARLAEIREEVAEIEEGAERIRRIVADLRVFARPDAIPGQGDVLSALRWALRVTETMFHRRARLDVELGTLPNVRGDVTRIGQVFINLLVNAAQAIPEGAPRQHRVCVSASVESNHVVIGISDTGCGMTPEVMRKIFDPFFTTKPAGSGTGLGLSVCSSIVESVGGKLTVASELGQGTTFHLWLPVAQALPEAPPERIDQAPRRGRILVVDRDRVTAASVARMLAKHHEVVVEPDAGGAVRRIEQDAAFDVLVCDLVMPEMTGIKMHRTLSKLKPELTDRLVFLTGGFSPEGLEFLASVQNPRLPKPPSKAELDRSIRSVLAREMNRG